MTTQYPSSIDTITTLYKVSDLISPVRAADHNQLRDAIVAIQAELGITPSGTFGTVKDRLNDIDGYFQVYSNELNRILEAANQAVEISISDVDGYYSSTDVEGALREIGEDISSLLGKIGPAVDGTYTDGLYTDFTEDTPIGTAVDRFNEVLLNLAPPAAPALSEITFSTSIGVEGKLSFGSSNTISGYTNVGTVGGGSAIDINGTFTSASGSALRKGIYDASTDIEGVVAGSITADTGTPNPSYPADAFGDGLTGTLQLEVNGTVVHSVDLTSFGSGNSLNGNGSGFKNVSNATSVSFTNGNSFSGFKYRTADWIVAAADQRNGYNYVRVIHNNSPTFTRTTNYFEWVVDDDTTATSFSVELLTGLSMTGSKFISGVEYHTGGTASYAVTINNLHRNTYSASATAISHPVSTNVSITDTALGTISAETDNEFNNKTVTIDANRLLNESISVNTQVDRTVQATQTSSTKTINNILMDNVSDDATNTTETFNGESYRVASNLSLTLASSLLYLDGGNDVLWDQEESLVGATDGYDDGLLVHGGLLYYPNNASVANGGDFANISNGPAGNPNYTGATGERVYLRYYYFDSTSANFILRLTGTGVSPVTVATGVTTGTGQVTIEALLPNTTQDELGLIEFKDCMVNFTDEDAIGCYAETYGANKGDTSGNDHGISFGSRNTSTSANAVIIRITAPQGWTGTISQLDLVAA